MKLIAIGFLSQFEVYVDLTKEEAMARYDRENPDYTIADQNLSVLELEVKDGNFTAYDIDGLKPCGQNPIIP